MLPCRQFTHTYIHIQYTKFNAARMASLEYIRSDWQVLDNQEFLLMATLFIGHNFSLLFFNWSFWPELVTRCSIYSSVAERTGRSVVHWYQPSRVHMRHMQSAHVRASRQTPTASSAVCKVSSHHSRYSRRPDYSADLGSPMYCQCESNLPGSTS